MADIVDSATRSRMMAGIRGKNTRPERIIRSAVHCTGFRYRLHDRRLPGSPDLVLPKYRAVIFVHGCFWHRHRGCAYSTIPASRSEFWQAKFESNVKRDSMNYRKLLDAGWQVVILWECGIRHDMEELFPLLISCLKEEWRGLKELPRVPPRLTSITPA